MTIGKNIVVLVTTENQEIVFDFAKKQGVYDFGLGQRDRVIYFSPIDTTYIDSVDGLSVHSQYFYDKHLKGNDSVIDCGDDIDKFMLMILEHFEKHSEEYDYYYRFINELEDYDY